LTGELVDAVTGRVIAGRVRGARGPLLRTFGLLGRRRLDADEGMWFERCDAVHTFGMQFAIDVIFLDASGIVVRVAAGVPPWRTAAAPGARDLVELAGGACAAADIRAGMRLEMRWHSPT
jgi:uncharacterized protein